MIHAQRPKRMIEVEGELREKNQLTVPKAIVDVIGAQPGDRFIFEVDLDQPDVFHVRRLRRSYAGILAGAYGTEEEAGAYLQGEREAWET